MKAHMPDPNNPVPEISPADGCDDVAESATRATILPSRRTATDPTTSPERTSAGLRIDSNLPRAPSAESAPRIEVQELNSPVVRLDQPTPAPPKVARQVTFRERPTREKEASNSAGESSAWGATRKLPKLWIIGSGAGVLALIVLFLALLPVINSRNTKKNSNRSAMTQPIVDEKNDELDLIDLLALKEPEAVKIFQAYVTATRVEDVIPLIRNGKALEETLRAHWRPSGISSSWVLSQDCNWSLQKLDGHSCGFLAGSLPDYSPFMAYFTNEGNRLQLDWKATSIFTTATFAELEKNTGDPTEIRGAISPAQFYTASWPETDYQSYRLTSPNGEDIIWCYSRRNTPPDDALRVLFRRDRLIALDTNSWKVTLRLDRGPADSMPNQWLIGEFLHLDWIKP